MMEKAAEKALDLLRALAEKLGTTVEQLYPYFVRQVLLEGWVGLLAGSLACGASAVLLAEICRRWNRENPDETFPGVLIGGLVGCVLVAIWSIIIYSNLPSIINPEYEAIQRIISAVTGK